MPCFGFSLVRFRAHRGSKAQDVARPMRRQNEEPQPIFAVDGLDAKARPEKSCGTAALPNGSSVRFRHDPAKSLVMTHLGQLVRDGFAEWLSLENDEVGLRFVSGEIFLLAEKTVTRIA